MSSLTMRKKTRWTFDLIRSDDGRGWPESRSQPYSRVAGRSYWPQRVHLEFVQTTGPIDLESLTIYGPRIVKAGATGAIVDERTYSYRGLDPWLEAIVQECRDMIEKESA
jgi:hypothetical protein